jgi:hypothetical protein
MSNTPSVAEVKRLAQKHGLRRCIVLFETAGGRPGYASYGQTPMLCNDTRTIADQMFDVLEEELCQR